MFQAAWHLNTHQYHTVERGWGEHSVVWPGTGSASLSAPRGELEEGETRCGFRRTPVSLVIPEWDENGVETEGAPNRVPCIV